MKGGIHPKTWGAILLFFLAAICAAASARTIYVDADAPGANDGSSWENAYNFLQDALADANYAVKPVEIRVAQGKYRPDENTMHPYGTGDRTATFQLINEVTLKGGDLDGNDVVINDPCDLLIEPSRAENSYHVVTGSKIDSNAVLDGFTITGGSANGTDRQNRRGGGMYSINSSVTILSCSFKWNLSLGWGGGIYNSNSSSKFINCTFIGNSRSGMYNYESSLMLTRCTFKRNLTPYYGGGIFNAFGTEITLIDCIFMCNNSYRQGGGIFNEYGSLSSELTNCIFVGNHSVSYGGGLFNGLSELSMTNCTFVGNSTDKNGGGVFIPPHPLLL